MFLSLNLYFRIHPKFLFLMSYQNNIKNIFSHFRKLVVLGQIILRNNMGMEYTHGEINLMNYVVLRKIPEFPDQVEKRKIIVTQLKWS